MISAIEEADGPAVVTWAVTAARTGAAVETREWTASGCCWVMCSLRSVTLEEVYWGQMVQGKRLWEVRATLEGGDCGGVSSGRLLRALRRGAVDEEEDLSGVGGSIVRDLVVRC